MTFEEMVEDQKILRKVLSNFKKEIAQILSVREEDILIIKIFKGSIKIEWINMNDLNRDEIVQTEKICKQIKSDIIKRTLAFRFSEKDFDNLGDFHGFNSSTLLRGPKGKTEDYT